MSGHSKWQTIKRKKGAQDAKRGAQFTKLANAITVAAREGADPDSNFRLRLAIEKAKKSNMPNANIERAIARGSGQTGSGNVEEVMYEGYGPGNAAIIVEGVTDSKNRTSSDIRNTFSKKGGTMTETGAVSSQFDHRGIITIEADDPDGAAMAAIEAGAADVATDEDEGVMTVYTEPTQLKQVQSRLGAYPVTMAELGYVPRHTIMIEDQETAWKVINLMNALEELDDVTNTYSNFDIPQGVV
jgi:YebC/PmpR family DNA-binding regulatory protein